jgi:hypothetical protein
MTPLGAQLAGISCEVWALSAALSSIPRLSTCRGCPVLVLARSLTKGGIAHTAGDAQACEYPLAGSAGGPAYGRTGSKLVIQTETVPPARGDHCRRRAVLCASKQDQGVYRLHALT